MSKIPAMNRRDWLWLAGLVLMGLVYWQCRGVDGSGKPGSERREVGAFTAVDVSGVIELDLKVGPERSIEITGDDNLLELVQTEVEGDRLVVTAKKNLDPDLPLVVHVVNPDFHEVEGSGAVSIGITGIDNDELVVELSGAGQIRAAGRTERLRLAISGAGDADTTALAARRIEVDVSGSGDVAVGEPEELDVEVSGAGDVTYGGNPKISQEISGAGKITKR
jgi:putative autotransporter adhesin-like protein